MLFILQATSSIAFHSSLTISSPVPCRACRTNSSPVPCRDCRRGSSGGVTWWQHLRKSATGGWWARRRLAYRNAPGGPLPGPPLRSGCLWAGLSCWSAIELLPVFRGPAPKGTPVLHRCRHQPPPSGEAKPAPALCKRGDKPSLAPGNMPSLSCSP
jgi:hypothetical protein